MRFAARLDQLDQKVQAGNLSPDGLAEARREVRVAIDNLPPDARAEYDRLHAVRHDASSLAYRAADPAFATAPDVNTEFRRAGLIAAASPPRDKGLPQESERCTPVYKEAPEF